MSTNARSTQGISSDLAASAADLQKPTRRNLILVMAAASLVAGAVTFPVEYGGTNLVIVLTVGASAGLALWLLDRRPLAAQAVWQVGMAAAITLATVRFRVPAIAVCYAVLPLTAVVASGPLAGLAAAALVSGLALGVYPTWFRTVLPPGYQNAVIAGSLFTGVLGYVISYSLLTATQWSLFSYGEARSSLEEVRTSRMELKQTQEDLIAANRELARLSERLKVMNEIAQEARQAKAEFVANVSHELRTPLNMIIGFSEMITRTPQVYDENLPPALLADIAAIQRNSRHLASLVDDVLDLSQVEAGRMALSKSHVSIPEVVDSAVAAVRSLFEAKGLVLEQQVERGLPSLFVDGTRIRQVLINLLSNAGRFTESGGVTVRASSSNGDLTITVADTGPGIAVEDHERLFEPFQQLDGSLRRSHSGSGLGLSISKRFVEMHGGRMWLESEVGLGTKISFSLPLRDAGTDPSHSQSGRYQYNPYRQFDARTRRSRAPAPDPAPRFVVLEEGDTLQRLFQRYLEGTEVVAVRDAESALRELESSPAQALVLNGQGAECSLAQINRLFSLPYGTPTISCWIPGHEEAAERLGVVRYLTKPVTPHQLLTSLQAIGLDTGTVLLVDDDPEALQLFSRMLSAPDRDYRVIQAETGNRALRFLRDRMPDVMLLDLVMPGMDGLEVLRRKNEDARIRGIPTIVLTSRDPSGQPIVSDTVTVSRSGGLSVTDLLACIRALTEVLAPASSPARQA